MERNGFVFAAAPPGRSWRQICAHVPPLAAVFVRAHLGMFSTVPD
jgi:hypothetical protein